MVLVISQEDGEIVVWKVTTGRKVVTLNATHGQQLVALEFDSTGRYLISVGHDKSHTLNVHEWAADRLVRNHLSPITLEGLPFPAVLQKLVQQKICQFALRS